MRTALADLHEAQNARFVSFAGWEMPLHYGSQIEEHHAVRTSAGCFDVSHMAVIDVAHSHSERLLRHILTGDVATLNRDESMYTLMLNPQGGIVDDLIVYRRESGFRLVVNAGTTDKDLKWMRQCTEKLNVKEPVTHRNELCILAVQGPDATEKVAAALSFPSLTNLPRFSCMEVGEWFIGRTGYTGEDGVEVVCPTRLARQLWGKLLDAGIVPAGLGARDSLRIEAGLNLYGHDMTEETTPFESRLAWAINWQDSDRNFIGRRALEEIRDNGSQAKLIGLRLTERGIPRQGYDVLTAAGEGVVTSGTFSPTLQIGIALARVPTKAKAPYTIRIRKQEIGAKIVRLPFTQNRLRTSTT